MARTVVVHGEVLTSPRSWERATVVIEGDKIMAVNRDEGANWGDALLLDAAGQRVVPGYLDIHVHGAAGADTMDATPEALATMAAFFARHGVTGFLPTTVTASREDTLAAIHAVTAFQQQPPQGAQALGVHLEGPYINPAQMGAQNPAFVRSPEPEEYLELLSSGPVVLLSLAPEDPASRELIAFAAMHGIRVALGHTSATYDQVIEAVGWGLSQATHTYNAMKGLHHREPGAAGAVLTCDELYAQIIVDLVHVHPAMVKLLVRAKGLERTVLITDAMRATGMPEGRYDLGGQEVIVANGEARLPAGNLAGSTLTMDRAVRNVMLAADLPLADAIRLATLTPAESLGIADHKGRLAPGWDADLVLLDDDLTPTLTMVQGRVVYRKE